MNKLSIIEQERWKTRVNREVAAAKHWAGKWGWIVEENLKVQGRIAEVTKKSLALQKLAEKEVADSRSISPIPESVNHQYGWICTKPEFQLQVYGPDVIIPKPVNEEP